MKVKYRGLSYRLVVSTEWQAG